MTVGAPDRAIIRSVVLGAGAQILAKIVHLGLNIVASLALIRYLGPAGYGDYAFVFGFSAIFGLMSDFGIPRVAVRGMARDPDSAPTVLGTAIVLRLILATASMVAAQLVLLMFGLRPELRTAIAVASLLFFTDALLSISAIFHVRLAMQYDGFVTVLAQAVDTALIVWLLGQHAELIRIVAAPVFSAALGVLVAAMIARGRFGARVSLDLRMAPGLAVAALPVGLTLLVAVVYLKLDNVLLGLMTNPTDVGLYAAAYKPIEYLLLASAVVIHPVFPLLARWYGTDMHRFGVVQRRGLQALLALVVPLAVVLALIAEPLLRAAYAADFLPAETPLRILGFALVFMNINVWQGFTLLAAGRQRVTMLYDAAGLVLNIVLNVVLIPIMSFLGAAIAALVTSMFIAAVATFIVHKQVHVRPEARGIGSVLLAAAGLGTLLWTLLAVGVPWLGASAVACLSYPLLLLVCHVTTLDELRLLPQQNAAAARVLEVG